MEKDGVGDSMPAPQLEGEYIFHPPAKDMEAIQIILGGGGGPWGSYVGSRGTTPHKLVLIFKSMLFMTLFTDQEKVVVNIQDNVHPYLTGSSLHLFTQQAIHSFYMPLYLTRLLGRPQPQMYPPVALNQHIWVNRTHKHFIYTGIYSRNRLQFNSMLKVLSTIWRNHLQ